MTDDEDILAAEFVLGLLGPDETKAFTARVVSDAALSSRVAWWQDQFARVIGEPEVAPPAHVWANIAARLSVNDNMPILLKRWRGLALGATGIAAALAMFIGLRQPAPVPPPPRPALMIATLSGDKNPAVVSVTYDGSSGQIIVAPKALSAGAGSAELWIIPEDGKPRSMGLIGTDSPGRYPVVTARHTFLHPGATFAISLEPKGGSATGAPTGPVIATGKIISI